MTPLLVVRGRPAPVLGEKERQPMAGARKIGLRVDRAQDRVDRDAVVEMADEGLEEGHPARGVVERRLVGHDPESTEPPGAATGSQSGRAGTWVGPDTNRNDRRSVAGGRLGERRLRLFFDCSSIVPQLVRWIESLTGGWQDSENVGVRPRST